jgi:hypothetical protein
VPLPQNLPTAAVLPHFWRREEKENLILPLLLLFLEKISSYGAVAGP